MRRLIALVIVSGMTVLGLVAGTAPVGATFPGKNGRIAFVREDSPGAAGIYTVREFGAGLTRLTIGKDYRPAWSPDGRQIVFQRFLGGVAHSDIYVMNADGSGLHRLTQRGGFQPDWSPDGTKIVFGSERYGDDDLFVMNADGSHEVRIGNTPYSDTRPSWSPDGSRIAFVSKRDGNTDIYLVNADGSNEQRLTTRSAVDKGPNWRPDGARIVFESRWHHSPSGLDLFTMRSDGTDLQRLTHNTAADWGAAWSPNGERIAFTRARYRQGEEISEDVVVIEVSSGDRYRIAISKADELEPAWQPL